MTEQKPLSDSEREDFARELTDEQLARSPAVDQPTAILTAGQPGSGKSWIVSNMTIHFENMEGPSVRIDPDLVRPTLPYMLDRIERGDLEIPGAAFADAGTIAARMMQMAAEGRRNLIYDGTLSNLHYARMNVEYLKSADYRVEVHGMAVPPDLSQASTYDRRENEIARSDTGFGRGVTDDFHDNAVKGLVETIEALQAEGKVDAIVLYDRSGNTVASTRLEGGQWVPDEKMADALRKAHAEPSQQSLSEAADTWDRAAELMRRRDADPQEQERIDARRDLAQDRAEPGPTVKPADEGTYHGPIAALDATTATQIADGNRVAHDRKYLYGDVSKLAEGQTVTISYRGGLGKVADPQQQDKTQGRSR